MALPQKVIEQLGRSPVKTPGWSGQLLMFSFTIFAISLAVYIGLIAGYRPYLESQVKKLDDQISQLNSQIPEKDQKDLINFYGQIANLNKLLNNHILGTQFFKWIEDNTQEHVYLMSLSVNLVGGQITLSGKARAVTDVAEQLAVFKNKKSDIGEVSFNGVAQGDDGLWAFTFVIAANPRLFTAQALQPAPESEQPAPEPQP